MSNVRILNETFTEEVASGEAHRHNVSDSNPATVSSVVSRLLTAHITIPAPTGASSGTHTVLLSLLQDTPGVGFLRVVFAQAYANFDQDLVVVGSNPSSSVLEHEATLPSTVDAWVSQVHNIYFKNDVLFSVQYLNGTNAAQTGERVYQFATLETRNA